MQEVFERIIDQLKAESVIVDDDAGNRAVEIIEQAAEEFATDTNVWNNGWIPCNSGKLPKENEYVRVTIWCGHEWIGCYRDGKWFVYGSAGLAEATVLAWQPTDPYQPKGE